MQFCIHIISTINRRIISLILYKAPAVFWFENIVTDSIFLLYVKQQRAIPSVVCNYLNLKQNLTLF